MSAFSLHDIHSVQPESLDTGKDAILRRYGLRYIILDEQCICVSLPVSDAYRLHLGCKYAPCGADSLYNVREGCRLSLVSMFRST